MVRLENAGSGEPRRQGAVRADAAGPEGISIQAGPERVADGTIAPEQRALPVLQTVAPRRRVPTAGGSTGARQRAPQPRYEPAPLAGRPHAAEIAAWSERLRDSSLLELGAAADQVRQRLHPEGVVSYIVDRNINYTNLCVTDCRFCAFYRRPKDAEAYVLSYHDVARKVAEAKALGAVQILMQGGHNPYLPLDWYLDLLRHLKEHEPIHVHGFSASEIELIVRVSKLPLDEVLRQLHEAGLDSMPGAGAEILVDGVRDVIAPKKIDSSRWLEIHETAHEVGLHTTATMMYGVGETWADRLEHLLRLRHSQARSATAGHRGRYTAFIAWSFQPSQTEMQDWTLALGTGMDYLRLTALSRLVLDNFANLQVSYVTQGPKLAQIALRFGANDFGSLMLEENVVSATGIDFIMPERELRRIIEDAGFAPRRRYQDYRLVADDDEGCPCCAWRGGTLREAVS